MFPEVGENLCQSVDRDAKGAKGTEDAKDKKPQITQISADFFCVLCEFLCPLRSFFNRCKSVSIGG